jgi:hypothetical protein
MDHIFVYEPSSGVNDPSVCSPQKAYFPDTCRECGCNCSKTEQRICLAEIDVVA